MKWLTLQITLVVGLVTFDAAFGTKCYVNPVPISRQWITMNPACIERMRRQIQLEVGISLQYLALGAHFSMADVNRPGFAEVFFQAASEEREHVIKLMEYLLLRGELTDDLTMLIHRSIKPIEEKEWDSGAAALEFALRLETEVTSHTRQVITVCEESRYFNDYHLADYLTSDFLGGQYRNQRNFAGKATTLKKMEAQHGALGEFLFDKKLLNTFADSN